MAGIDVKITENHVQEALDQINRNIEAALEAVGIFAEGRAMDIIDAGIPRHADSWYTSKGGAGLRGSITHLVDMSQKAVHVGTNNEHAIYNELGTGIYLEAEDGRKGRQSPWSYQDEDGNWHRTRGITPLHFLKKSFTENEAEIREILGEYLGRE